MNDQLLKPSSVSNIRILVLRENWLGCTGLSAFNAFLRTGAWADSITESDFIPQNWHGFTARVLGRIVRPLAAQEFNRALLREAHLMKPHIFFAVKGGYVCADTLQAFRESGITSYCFYPDVSFTAHTKYLLTALKHYDWIFTTKSFGHEDLKRLFGIENSSFLPHAYDPDVHQPRPVTPDIERIFGCDVSFIGTWSPKKEHLLEALITHRPHLKLKIWGNRWSNLSATSSLHKFTAFQVVTGRGYAAAISSSRINLGILSERVSGASSGDLITSRTFHIPACGGLMLHERTDDLLQIFRENESCVCFSTVDEMIEKIDWLLEDESTRLAIAARGREVVIQAHSWDHRVKTVLDHYFST